MGIRGLSKILRRHAPSAVEERQVEDLRGLRIAFDAAVCIYQCLASSVGLETKERESQSPSPPPVFEGGDGTAVTTSTSPSSLHSEGSSHLLASLLLRVARLIELGVKPLFVFEGSTPELKKELAERRQTARQAAGERLRLAVASGESQEEQRRWRQRALKCSEAHIEDAMGLLDLLGVQTLRAPFEGEALCALLERAGRVDAVASEDLDGLAFGASVLFRYVHQAVSPLASKTLERFSLPEALSKLRLKSQAEFVDFCILSGCDYLPTIPGIGPESALSLMKKFKSIEKVLDKLDARRHKAPSADFLSGVVEVRDWFLNPPVDSTTDPATVGDVLSLSERVSRYRSSSQESTSEGCSEVFPFPFRPSEAVSFLEQRGVSESTARRGVRRIARAIEAEGRHLGISFPSSLSSAGLLTAAAVSVKGRQLGSRTRRGPGGSPDSVSAAAGLNFVKSREAAGERKRKQATLESFLSTKSQTKGPREAPDSDAELNSESPSLVVLFQEEGEGEERDNGTSKNLQAGKSKENHVNGTSTQSELCPRENATKGKEVSPHQSQPLSTRPIRKSKEELHRHSFSFPPSRFASLASAAKRHPQLSSSSSSPSPLLDQLPPPSLAKREKRMKTTSDSLLPEIQNNSEAVPFLPSSRCLNMNQADQIQPQTQRSNLKPKIRLPPFPSAVSEGVSASQRARTQTRPPKITLPPPTSHKKTKKVSISRKGKGVSRQQHKQHQSSGGKTTKVQSRLLIRQTPESLLSLSKPAAIGSQSASMRLGGQRSEGREYEGGL
uniref:Exonuclease 1 n=1 Tax=Chromera velia CCMP2878 TaxID=1169474 RepID=A0A0G4HJT0_9ALVE|eukprot:Cvel_7178.t1-p1 / transcript=Cvel_7178.t1 / gene=Cvel_7178 / organism=Chromera_velia_CCMP2878 / gene_product=Flap endonuclease 1, putative / transcript_product=Flap endonuclease 1, putative / location=Cvel_scaffold369:49204-52765(+) / protein_length=782 / sequence_SO=supercontig / SO=protein_coding / is_pseudo=false